MRHLIVCCDGTWQTAEQPNPTNVSRLVEALAPTDADGAEQVPKYVPGVGSGPWWKRWPGGAAGVGLSEDVLEAYTWLTTNYEPGDQIALFGFSRGAFTARSLSGVISACGLLDTSELDEDELGGRIEQVYDRGYRRRPPDPGWRDGLEFAFDPADAGQIPVRFVGVWDTVGALGVPDHLGWVNLVDSPRRYEFHDVTLNPHIRHGRHAVALDEFRGPFAPTLWAAPAPGQDLKQVWFPGDHGDVGGGHPQTGLSDGALQWMIDEASAAVGLEFDPAALATIKPDPGGELHRDTRSVAGPLAPVVQALFQPRPRAVPLLDPEEPSPSVHPSVHQRQQLSSLPGGPYRPTRRLTAGESVTVEVAAGEPWNATGLYLEPAEYQFAAEGQWHTATTPSGPAGESNRHRLRPPALGQLAGTLLGRAEGLFRWASGNQSADFLFARREEDLPWASLVAIVANEISNANGEIKKRHERIAIGDGTRARVARGGYLYAYANDAWGCYGDNQGLVRLTATRTP